MEMIVRNAKFEDMKQVGHIMSVSFRTAFADFVSQQTMDACAQEDVLTDKDQLILVYCRSGRRSKLAAEALVELGYTNIKEFGGIQDWTYELE